MEIRMEDGGPCRRVLHVAAPFPEIEKEYDEIVGAYSDAAKVPGFRGGKAPAGVIEKRYRKQISQDTQERVLPRLYHQAIEQEKVKAVAIVGMEDVQLDRSAGLRFRVTVDVTPEFSLPKYRRIALKRNKVDVTAEEEAGAFDRLVENFSRFDDVTDRPVQADDMVQIDYAGSREGTPLQEIVPGNQGLAEAKDFWTVAGEPDFLPGMGKGLVGAAIGDGRDITVHFPDDFRTAVLAGTDCVYHVDVKAIRQKVAPEIDGEFLKRFEVDCETALREKIRADLLQAAEQREQERLKEEVAKFLLEKVSFDLPQAVVEQETRTTIQGLAERFARSGATREQMEQHQEQIMSTATETSTERVKLSYILTRIGDAEDITVADAEVDERINELASQYWMPPERFRAELEKRNSIDNVRGELRADKTMQFLLEHARIKG